MNSHIQTTTRTVRAGRVQVLGSVYEVPALLRASLEDVQMAVDFHVHDASGVRLRSQGDAVSCWAPFVASLNPFLPASAAAESQSPSEGPSPQAASGGHPSYFSDAVIAEARRFRVSVRTPNQGGQA